MDEPEERLLCLTKAGQGRPWVPRARILHSLPAARQRKPNLDGPHDGSECGRAQAVRPFQHNVAKRVRHERTDDGYEYECLWLVVIFRDRHQRLRPARTGAHDTSP